MNYLRLGIQIRELNKSFGKIFFPINLLNICDKKLDSHE
jgi:hypothetical protein